jgi:hypothetical protein
MDIKSMTKLEGLNGTLYPGIRISNTANCFESIVSMSKQKKFDQSSYPGHRHSHLASQFGRVVNSINMDVFDFGHANDRSSRTGRYQRG